MDTYKEMKIVKLLPMTCLSTAFLVLSYAHLILLVASVLSPAETLSQEPMPVAGPSAPTTSASLTTNQFILVTTPNGFVLQFASRGKKKQIPIPREWLVLPEEEKEEEDAFVSSFKYKRQITSFDIGNGQIGLHVSSFDLMTEGSAQAAAGRDVFLTYDGNSSVLGRGNLDLGITKKRVRDGGCFSAEMSHFLLADMNRDGLTDIGVIREEISCDPAAEGGPALYEQRPVRWYVYTPDGWKEDSQNSGNLPVNYSELPLIGIDLGPVDYVAYGLWRSRDPAKWRTRDGQPPRFLPSYRRQLMHHESGKINTSPAPTASVAMSTWDTREDTAVYHPVTVFEPFTGSVNLLSGAEKGTFAQQYVVVDRQSNATLNYEAKFAVR